MEKFASWIQLFVWWNGKKLVKMEKATVSVCLVSRPLVGGRISTKRIRLGNYFSAELG